MTEDDPSGTRRTSRRVSALLHDDAALVPERFHVSAPIEKTGDLISMSGNKAHSGGTDAGLIVANPKTNELWIW